MTRLPTESLNAVARLDAIKAELAEIESRRSELVTERDELEGALSIVLRYEDDLHLPDLNREVRKVVAKELPAGRKDQSGAPRPEGIPTIWEMTEETISASQGRTASVDDLLERIGNRWWPGVVRNQIAPQVYRFAKDGRLEQVDKGVFALPRKSDSAGSEKQEAEEDSPLFGPYYSNPASHGA